MPCSTASTPWCLVALVLLASACKPKDLDVDVELPTFGQPTEMAGASDGLDRPQDLDFHPTDERGFELWVVNKGTEDTGSDVVIVHNAGKSDQRTERRIDGNAWHFMNLTTGIAFSDDNGNWASSPEITDANHSGGTFTGPSLWSSDLEVFAMPSGGNGSHLDMLHQSPNSMGIAHEVDNAFWVFDGYSNEIVRYDFVDDHGPGNDDHSDGRVHRYSSLPISRLANTPSHLVLDKTTDWLYIADPANSQVLRMDITSGEFGRALPPTNEPLAELFQMRNEVWEEFAVSGLDQPSGIEVADGLLYVGDAASGTVIVYAVDTGEELTRIETGAQKLLGLKLDPDGNLWFVDRGRNTVNRIEAL